MAKITADNKIIGRPKKGQAQALKNARKRKATAEAKKKAQKKVQLAEWEMLYAKIGPFLKTGQSVRSACISAKVDRNKVYELLKENAIFAEMVKDDKEFLLRVCDTTIYRSIAVRGDVNSAWRYKEKFDKRYKPDPIELDHKGVVTFAFQQSPFMNGVAKQATKKDEQPKPNTKPKADPAS